MNAGFTARAGAITLIRPEPGFHYVVQTPGGFRMGPEVCFLPHSKSIQIQSTQVMSCSLPFSSDSGSQYTYARGEETFHGFMNFLQQSRTTKRFSFFSLDRQRAEVRLVLS